jgi:exodeoxyribonuclease V alpha subunit
VIAEADPLDPRRPLLAGGLLAPFVQAGVLGAADVHVAVRLCALAGEGDERVALAVALAVRAPRLGHVHVDLRRIRATAAVEREQPLEVARELPWPQADGWLQAVAGSALLAARDEVLGEGEAAPLRLDRERLYLDRYWQLERALARDIAARCTAVEKLREELLADGIARLFDPGEGSERQRAAAVAALRRRFTVIAGGPGTGKTTMVAAILALLGEQALARGQRPPLVALAAPTGRAAARLAEAVHAQAPALDTDPRVRERLADVRAGTIHRLLGFRPDNHSRFRHDRRRRLAHDVVLVDESSMVSLALMARLLEAVRPQARVVLIGDPGQLASVEAGAVLADIVGPAGAGPAALGAGIVTLERVHRFGAGIAALAGAIRAGEVERVLALLREGPEGITWLQADAAEGADVPALAPLRARAQRSAESMRAAARAGEAGRALAALGRFRLLCAHRRGPYGAARWGALIESWLAASEPLESAWYAGRPLLVNANDYELGLFNGDGGVVVGGSGDGGMAPLAVFERGGELRTFAPARLGAVDTAHAITIHKSQGSQFDTVAVLLPDPSSPLLTRELLYTAVTRARREVLLLAGEESIRRAVSRPIARASGLRELLWEA